jgi:uncharacterized damage-inducible protein DinB
MKRLLSVAAMALACPCILLAQGMHTAVPGNTPMANPVSQALRDLEVSSAKNMVAAAEAMPADKYDYKPTPEQITFGHLILHIAQSNTGLCSKISGQAPPAAEQLTETSGKDKLVAAIKASFEYCGQVLPGVDDAGLGNTISLSPTRNFTKARTMMILADDWADHYSSEAAYLRMNGILPPTAPQPAPPKQ